MSIKGKVAIVTGGNSGMGRAISMLFAKEGARVVIADLAGGNEVADGIKQAGGEATFVQTDVSKSEDVRNLVNATMKKYGRLDVLVNAAGIWEEASVADTSEELWNKTINVNMKGPFLTMKYAILEMMKSGGGAIINISSVGGICGSYGEFAYGASKGALVQMTRNAALDCAAKNIRVNCVCPATADTPMTHNWLKISPEHEKELVKQIEAIPIKRLIKPEEVAYSVLFLASDESSAITGAILPVDGGFIVL